jgi:hypothetical protein
LTPTPGGTNAPPVVSLTSPVGGSLYTAPASILLSAAASDPDGFVSRVDFYDGPALVGSDSTAPYSFTLTDAAEGAHSLTAVAVDNQLAPTTSAAIGVSAQAFGGWAHQDIGAVGVAGDASYANGAFTVVGSGFDITGSADEFHFVYVPVTGNATVVARVASIQNTNVEAKGGVMIRESLAANSRYAAMLLTSTRGVKFQQRSGNGGTTVHTTGAQVSAPYWVKLVRSGSTFTGWSSPDGVTWTFLTSGTAAAPSNVLVGLALTSRADGVLNTSVFDNVSVLTDSANAPPTLSVSTPPPGAVFASPGAFSFDATAADAGGSVSRVDVYEGGTLIGSDTTSPYSIPVSGLPEGAHVFTVIATDNLNATTATPPIGVTVSSSPPPAPWLDADVGLTALGSASFLGSTFTVRGSGRDISASDDEFHYTYQPVSGDVTIIARVASIQNTHTAARGGIMIRENLAVGSRHASMLLTPSSASVCHRRAATGGTTSVTAGPVAAPPRWIKLVRAGSSFSGYISDDGAAWTLVGSGNVSLPANALVGLAVSSHVVGTINTSTFDSITVTSP